MVGKRILKNSEQAIIKLTINLMNKYG